MSAEDLSRCLREKMGQQRTNNTEMARQANISRRTWYRLLDSDIEESKMSTLLKLSKVLDISITELIHIYFKK